MVSKNEPVLARCKYSNWFNDITCHNRAIGYIKISPNEELGHGKVKIPICKLHKDLIFETDELQKKDPTHIQAHCVFIKKN